MIANNMSIVDSSKFPAVAAAAVAQSIVKPDETKSEEVKLDLLTEALKSNNVVNTIDENDL